MVGGREGKPLLSPTTLQLLPPRSLPLGSRIGVMGEGRGMFFVKFLSDFFFGPFLPSFLPPSLTGSHHTSLFPLPVAFAVAVPSPSAMHSPLRLRLRLQSLAHSQSAAQRTAHHTRRSRRLPSSLPPFPPPLPLLSLLSSPLFSSLPLSSSLFPPFSLSLSVVSLPSSFFLRVRVHSTKEEKERNWRQIRTNVETGHLFVTSGSEKNRRHFLEI